MTYTQPLKFDPVFRSKHHPVILWDQGIVAYKTAWKWQCDLVKQRKQDPHQPDALLLLEHLPVYTLGQGASDRFLHFNPQTTQDQIYRTERGGEVTYHCPGQLVGYPILNLHHYRQDLHWYLRGLEEVIINTIKMLHLPAQRISGLTGVWVKEHKVAAIGIKVSRWITMHGFALNVCPDMEGFQRIVPCGIENRPVGSLHHFLPDITLPEVKGLLIQNFANVFKIQWQKMEFPFD